MPIGVPLRERLMHYAIRGAMTAVDLMIWPVATVTGLGHAVLSRWGPLRQPATGGRAPAARSGAARSGAARSGATRRG
jgi:hypothetical protein